MKSFFVANYLNHPFETSILTNSSSLEIFYKMFVFIQCLYSSKTMTFTKNNVTVSRLQEAFTIDLNEGLPKLLKNSAIQINFILPNEEGTYEGLESNETYTCFYEENLSDDDSKLDQKLLKTLDEKLCSSIRFQLREYSEIDQFLSSEAISLYMDGPENKEKRHNFRRKVQDLFHCQIDHVGTHTFCLRR